MHYVELDDIEIVDVKGVLYCRFDTPSGHRFFRVEEESAKEYLKYPTPEGELDAILNTVEDMAYNPPKAPRPFFYEKVTVMADGGSGLDDYTIYVVNNRTQMLVDSSALWEPEPPFFWT